MGPAHHARHQRPQQDLSRSHFFDERPGDGHQGHPIVSQRSVNRRLVRRLGSQVLLTHHRVLHLRTDTADVDKLMVTFVCLHGNNFLFLTLHDCFSRWFFAMISISGVFAVTFSVVFAYVADVTTIENRSRAYGMVSATFAASLVSDKIKHVRRFY